MSEKGIRQIKGRRPWGWMVPNTVRGTLVEITERMCNDKMQPYVKVGKFYMVDEPRQLTDGTPVLVVRNPDKKGCTLRINANRFKWKRTSFDEIKQKQNELLFRAEEKHINDFLKKEMSTEEAVTTVYVPHVVETLAVRCLVRCAEICRDKQWSEYKCISREVRDIEVNNPREQIAEIKLEVYKLVEAACDGYLAEAAEGIRVLHTSIVRELKRAYPLSLPEALEKNPLRSEAIFGIILLKVLKLCYLDHDNYVAKGVGEMLYVENNRIADIEKCLHVYAGNIEKFDFNAEMIANGAMMIKDRLTNIKFRVTDKND